MGCFALQYEKKKSPKPVLILSHREQARLRVGNDQCLFLMEKRGLWTSRVYLEYFLHGAQLEKILLTSPAKAGPILLLNSALASFCLGSEWTPPLVLGPQTRMSRVSCEALKSVRNAQKKTSFNL
jgi:hypothetical protein